MTLQDVANEVGIHVSTVSRAVKNKYLETPRGVYSFKTFFVVPALKNEAGEGTGESAKRAICRVVAEENKKKPLSDQKISEALAAEGVVLSRRTVAKYREELGIGSAFERRE